ncbi:MAG: hypothetical protein P9L99_12105 [Candidatus Lernaella stagnicola]|nr:hypothetical protein [Candidatus Lernaella stagnicola]
MMTRKQWMAIVGAWLALAFLLTGLAACGGGGDDNSANLGGDDDASATDDDDMPTPGPGDDDDDDDDTTPGDDDTTPGDDDTTPGDDDTTPGDDDDDDTTPGDDDDDDTTPGDDDDDDDDTTPGDDDDDDDDDDDNDDDDTTPSLGGVPIFSALRSLYGGNDGTKGYFIHLEWLEAVDPDGEDIIYNIYETDDPNNMSYDTPAYTTANLEYDVTGFASGDFYCYSVRAEDESGNEDENSFVNCAVAADAFYVDAINGADPAAGTAEDPFESLDQANDELQGTAAVTTNIYIAEGTYVGGILPVNDLVGIYGGWHNDTSKGTWTRDIDAYLTTLNPSSGTAFETASATTMIDAFSLSCGGATGIVMGPGLTAAANVVFDACPIGVSVTASATDQTIGEIAHSEFVGGLNGITGVTSTSGSVIVVSFNNHFDAVEEPISITHNSGGSMVAQAFGNTIEDAETGISIVSDNGEAAVQIYENTIVASSDTAIFFSSDSPGASQFVQIGDNRIVYSANYGIHINSTNGGDESTVFLERNTLVSNAKGVFLEAIEDAGDSSFGTYRVSNNLVVGGENGILLEFTNNGLSDLEFVPWILNNAVMNASDDGIHMLVNQTGGSLEPSPRIFNNDVFGCDGSGLYFSFQPPSPTGEPQVYNNIVLDNDLEDITVFAGVPGDQIAFNNYSTGDGSGPGNISADPMITHLPSGFDRTDAVGTTTTLEVAVAGEYTTGEYIEIDNDGVAREITDVTSTTITFSPAYSRAVPAGAAIFLWGASDDVDEDFTLVTGSPCINAGNPEGAFNDLDGTRNDMGVTGGQFYSPR